jgi:NTE family protein
MASAAFPGVFNSVSLKRYPSLTSPNSTSPSIPVGYEHLLDGGPTDNLGIESLVALAASHQRSFERNNPNGSSQAPCFIFVADAYPPGISGKKAGTPDARSFIDHFVDMNFLDAFDALLRRRRLDLLAYVGLGESPEVSNNRFIGDFIQPLSIGNLGSDSIRPAQQLVEVDIPKQFSDSHHGWSRIRAVEGSFRNSWFTGAPASPPVPNGYFRCTVWHLNLAGVLDLKPFVKGADNQPARLRNDDSGRNSPILQHRAKLKRIVSQIDTNIKLSGPENCSKDFLQDAIYASAFVVTREDHYTRVQVCDWFEKSGLSTSRECKLFPGNQSLQLQLDILPSGQLKAERPGDTAVQCKK